MYVACRAEDFDIMKSYYCKLLFTIILTLIHPVFTHQSNLSYPCNNPSQSLYLFCNKSLPIATRTNSLLSQLTLSEKIQFLWTHFTGIPRLGLPPYQWWSEANHGISNNCPGVNFNGIIKSATMFPQVLNQAATFNKTLWFDIGKAASIEGRSLYNVGQSGLTFWAPNINVFRDPRWGRGQDTPGEDPFVVSQYAIEFVKGFQGEYKREINNDNDGVKRRVMMGNDGVDDNEGGLLMLSACCKHLIAYDLEKWGNFSRYSFHAVVNRQDMEDTYQPPFESCVKHGKASCLMCSYTSVNGVPACARGDLLQRARNEWGFKGYVVSDYDAVATMYESQFYSKSPEDAVAEALKAGVDIDSGTYLLYHTESAIEHGKVNEADIDRSLKNLFPVLLRLGFFDGDPLKGRFGSLGTQDVCTKEHQRLALDGAKQSIVLLKNDKNFLPLRRNHVSSLAIIGPGARNLRQLGGEFSGVPCNAKNYFDGLQKYVKQTAYVGGCLDVTCESDSMFGEALIVAKKSDYVIVVVGLDLSQETEDMDRVSLLLPGKQKELVSLVAAASKRPVILVLTGGGPLDVSFAKEDPQIASILWVGYAGEAGGKALAEVVFGEYNPGGRLPMTWYPESFTNVPMDNMNMRADPSRHYPGRTHRFYTGDTVYRFGDGLSYTNFTYRFLSAPRKISLLGKLQAATSSVRQLYQTKVGIDYITIDKLSCEALRFEVQISVQNVGHIDGSHAVLLYSKALKSMEDAPKKQLVGFSRVNTVAQGSTDAIFIVDPCEHLSFANEHGKRILTMGEHVLILEDLQHSFLIGM